MAHSARSWTLYALVIPKGRERYHGAVYIGITGRPLAERIAEHRAGKGHTARQRKWLGRNTWEPWVILSGLTEQEAAIAEPLWIKRYRPPANTVGVRSGR